MSHPYSRTETFTAAGSGDTYATKTHSTIGLYVQAEGATSPSNITFDVTIEGSPDGEFFVTLDRPSVDDPLSLSDSDTTIVQNSGPAVKAGYVSVHNFAIEVVRMTVNSMSAETDEITMTMFLSGNSARGVQFDRSLDL